jgi:hypothetical protein
MVVVIGDLIYGFVHSLTAGFIECDRALS